MNCKFCRIAAGEEPAHLVYEGDETVAFLDVNPAVAGHTLVVPRTHVEDLITAPDPLPGDVFRTMQRVGTALSATYDTDGFSVFHTSGGLVGRIDHAHVHLLPRREDDDVHLSLARESLDEATGERTAARIRENLESV